MLRLGSRGYATAARRLSQRAPAGMLSKLPSRPASSTMKSVVEQRVSRPQHGAASMQSIWLRSFSSSTVQVIEVPAMGDSITEGTVGEIHVEVGDVVAMDQLLMSLDTDKVSVDVRAPFAGKVTELFAVPDDAVQIGAPLFNIDTSFSAEAGSASKESAPTSTAPPKTTPTPPKPAAPKPAPTKKSPNPTSAMPSPTSLGFNSSVMNGSNAIYVDSMYSHWMKDRTSVHPSWDAFFSSIDDSGVSPDAAFTAPPSLSGQPVPAPGSVVADSDTAKVLHLIAAYQRRGHEMATLDPLGLDAPQTIQQIKELDPATYGFSDADWDRALNLSGYFMENVAGLMGKADLHGDADGKTSLRELVEFLNRIYCGSIGIEVDHVNDLEKLNWLRSKIEVKPIEFDHKSKRQILERLAYSETFESFLRTRFQTAKRFGLEGLESLIPGLKELVDLITLHGAEEVVIGMAHRGRLNVMANVLRKPLDTIFREFHGVHLELEGSQYGDVKYHMGTSFIRSYPSPKRTVMLEILPNPSHLEAVNPVVAGRVRARMDQVQDSDGTTAVPIIIHGDAAFAGQGVVYETMQMAKLDGFQTGGTINVICNNQIGFTANPSDGRSTKYASDLGKAFNCPIFHVNAEDVEAVCRCFRVAAAWRSKYKSDIIIDLIGYRKFGHNENDEPMFTHPKMYQVIQNQDNPLHLYKEQLVSEGTFTEAEVDEVISNVRSVFDEAYKKSKETRPSTQANQWLGDQDAYKQWADIVPMHVKTAELWKTGLKDEVLQNVGKALRTAPDGFTLHGVIKRACAAREKMFAGTKGIDWATAEQLALGSLCLEGTNVRFSGQDVQRGTFSHRHAVIHDQTGNGQSHTWVNHIQEDQPGKLHIYNSFLSEYAVLGFELGYSFHCPNNLVIWEAQFGDFVNGAQIIIDNFLSACESKWGRQTGLTLLLPHGYQGAGPEHSSCRIERFLTSCDEDPDHIPEDLETQDGKIAAAQANNWSVVNPSTPANYFHVLRRQQHRNFRKPLIVASTKALLRDDRAVSSLDEFGEHGKFHHVLPELHPESIVEDGKIRKVVFCTGKVYYELLRKREEESIDDVALVRVEQLAPFPFPEVAEHVKKYPNAEVVWCQEEPKNMGFWYFVQDRFLTATDKFNGSAVRPTYVGRAPRASPAEGWGDDHAKFQGDLLHRALYDSSVPPVK